MAATQALAEASGGEVVFEGYPWNSNTVDLIRLARAHCLLVLHSTFADSVSQLGAQVPPPLCCSRPTKHMPVHRHPPCWPMSYLGSSLGQEVVDRESLGTQVQVHGSACGCFHAQLPDSRLQRVQGSVDAPAVAALAKLLSLFGLSFIAREAGDFLEDGYLSGQQVCPGSVTDTRLT